jgi:ribosome-associated translation inhibitor RaiA
MEITFVNLEHSDAIEARVREEAEKLDHFYDRITSMRVVVTRPQHRHNRGDTYQVRIHMTVPGAADVAVSRDPGEEPAHTDVYVAVRDAFKAARRQLQDTVGRR